MTVLLINHNLKLEETLFKYKSFSNGFEKQNNTIQKTVIILRLLIDAISL